MPRIRSHGVDDDVENAVDLPQGLDALLAIVGAAIHRFDDLAIVEDAGGLEEIDLSPRQIVEALGFIPFEAHADRYA